MVDTLELKMYDYEYPIGNKILTGKEKSYLDLVRITPSSWSRGVKGTSEMTLAEIQRIVDTLNLSEEEVKEIFF